jgi:hypothetical protein
MNDITIGLDQNENEEDLLIYEIADEMLEPAYTGNEKAGNFTVWWAVPPCTIAPALSGCGN